VSYHAGNRGELEGEEKREKKKGDEKQKQKGEERRMYCS
jgi:hypothetical protein